MSDKVYTNDGVYIAKAMLEHLNSWEGKPVDIKFEGFTKTPPSMMMQQLTGAIKKRAYINGSYLGSWPFAIYIRVDGSDTAGKLDASEALNNIAEWLSLTPLPTLGDNRTALKIEMTGLPSIAARYEDGCEDYQAIFELEYKQGGYLNV